MEELTSRLNVVETKVEEMRYRLDEVKNGLQIYADENAVRVIVDESLHVKQFVQDHEVIILIQQTLDQKDYATKAAVQAVVREHQIKLIQWVIGTGISLVGMTLTIVKYFL